MFPYTSGLGFPQSKRGKVCTSIFVFICVIGVWTLLWWDTCTEGVSSKDEDKGSQRSQEKAVYWCNGTIVYKVKNQQPMTLSDEELDILENQCGNNTGETNLNLDPESLRYNQSLTAKLHLYRKYPIEVSQSVFVCRSSKCETSDPLLISVAGNDVISDPTEVHQFRHQKKRVKRTDASLDGSGFVVRPTTSSDPCDPETKFADWEKKDLYLCYNGTKIDTTLFIPFTAIKTPYRSWKGNPGKWQTYDFYIDLRGESGSHVWGYTVANTGHWKTSSYGYYETAWKSRFTNFQVDHTNSRFVLSINSTSFPIPEPKRTCHHLFLCAWAKGTDPCWQLGLCPDKRVHVVSNTLTNTNTNPTKDKGTLRPGPGSPSSKSIKIVVPKEVDDWFLVTTGVSGKTNNWLLMAEQAANLAQTDCLVCMGPRPIMKVVPAVISSRCVRDVMTNTTPYQESCKVFDKYHPVAQSEKKKPLFDKNVAHQNFSCFQLAGNVEKIGNISKGWCNNIQKFDVFKPIARADVWIWCGTDQIFDRLPINSTGRCALVSLLMPVLVEPISFEYLLQLPQRLQDVLLEHRSKRSATPWLEVGDPTYIDSIGVPRGVPDEYKLVNQVAAGWESILLWITPNKNVDRINYIHYNVQKLGNYTALGFEAVHEQLKATSLMAFQNRIALDMLLAEKSGVCGIFGDQCCTFIPNNTQAGGKLTLAIEGLRTLNKKMKDHSGVDTSMWDNWMKVFGPWKTLISSILVAVAVFAAILTLCGCCCIPCIRTLITRLIERAVGARDREHGQYAMLPLADPPLPVVVDDHLM